MQSYTRLDTFGIGVKRLICVRFQLWPAMESYKAEQDLMEQVHTYNMCNVSVMQRQNLLSDIFIVKFSVRV